MNETTLLRKIERRDAVIGVIGLGYVGLPVACLFAEAGFDVIGLDIDAERVGLIGAGECPIEGEEPGLAELLEAVVSREKLQVTTDYDRLSAAHVVLIAVETPVDERHEPRYVALRNACQSLAKVLAEGTLVIIESTTAPGTVDGLVRPIVEQSSGMRADEDFFLGVCPERVMPGRLLRNMRTVSRVCGGSTPETADMMVALYRHVVQAELDRADTVTAEIVKTAENAYRDVQIAFANEVALVCEAAGANVWRVRELVNKSPGRQMLLPGAGVGGHCIPKDPWLLAFGAGENVPLKLIPAARAVNDGMPQHMAELLRQALEEAGRPLSQARVLILGYSYLENSDDTRNSPSESLVHLLEDAGAEVIVHDPWVPGFQSELLAAADECDATVIMVAHQAYFELDLRLLREVLRTPVLVDGRHVVDGLAAREEGFIFRGIGQSHR